MGNLEGDRLTQEASDREKLFAGVKAVLDTLSDDHLSQFYHTIMTPNPTARQKSSAREWFPKVEPLFGGANDVTNEIRGAISHFAYVRLDNLLFPVDTTRNYGRR